MDNSDFKDRRGDAWGKIETKLNRAIGMLIVPAMAPNSDPVVREAWETALEAARELDDFWHEYVDT